MKIRNEHMRNTFPGRECKSLRTTLDPCDVNVSLADAIHDKRLRIGFRKFLEAEFSVENLDFWLAVEQYKKITNEKTLQAKAVEIYQGYVSSSSPNQVNLDYHTRQGIVKQMSEKIDGNSVLFDDAQKYIFTVMESDSYARFVRSKYYDICSPSGRRSPRKFLQGIIQGSMKRSPSPNALGKRLSNP